ncbi:MAG: hypothetical protein ACQESR_03065 [Planctomycetota bacterium]
MVGATDEPFVVRRYRRQDMVIVPLWMWRQLIDVAHQTPNEEDSNATEAD